ncbi:hypothetical protein [Tunturiibacter lichenicola]|uniref:hypothetical protein n=1 Tax=Tunturiibacter lichenicola TaxID=2051959 RepID=UPI003D9B804E
MFGYIRGAVRQLIISSLLPLACCFAAQAQNTVKILKIAPPNWWAAMPKPMLLVEGEHLDHRLAQGDFKPLTDPHAPWLTQRDVTQGWLAVTNTALENCQEVTFLLGSDLSPKFDGDSLIFTLQPNGAAVLEAQ